MKDKKFKRFKELHMDTYINEPYMLLSRVVDKNISYHLLNDRLILRKKDDTVILNIPFDMIEDCDVNEFSDSHCQILFSICNIQYKVLAVM